MSTEYSHLAEIQPDQYRQKKKAEREQKAARADKRQKQRSHSIYSSIMAVVMAVSCCVSWSIYHFGQEAH